MLCACLVAYSCPMPLDLSAVEPKPRSDPLFSAAVMLPILATSLLLRRNKKKPPWDGYRPYATPDEFGETKRATHGVLMPANSYSSVAYWAAGVSVLQDAWNRATGGLAKGSAAGCVDSFETMILWHIAVGLALLWVGASSLLFHVRELSSSIHLASELLGVISHSRGELPPLPSPPQSSLLRIARLHARDRISRGDCAS